MPRRRSANAFVEETPIKATRERIIEVAAQLFTKQGYEGTTMRQIAAAAGVSKPGLYHHFASKEELCSAFAESLHHEALSFMRDAARPDLAPRERLQAFVRAYVHYQLGDPTRATRFGFYQITAALSEEHRQQISRIEREYARFVRQILEDGLEDGSFANIDPAFTAIVICTACEYVFVWLTKDGLWSTDEIASRYAELMTALASGDVAASNVRLTR